MILQDIIPTKKKGEADSTTNVGNAGQSLFHAYQNKNFKAFVEDMTEEYLDEDNTKVILTNYMNWLAIAAIHKYFDEYLKINRTLNINAIPLKNYLSKVILMLKYKFPNRFA